MLLHSFLALVGLVAAVFREDVGVADWKQSYIGTPLHVSEYDHYIAVVSDANSLTCLSPNGMTSWRRTLSSDQLSSGVALVRDTIVVGGSELTAFDAHKGVPLWSKPIPAAEVHAFEDLFVVGNKLLVNETGHIVGDATRDMGSPLKIQDNSVALSNGTLSWDEFGVLTLESYAGETLIWRNEGLAHIKKGLFVPVEKETEAENDLVVAQGNLPAVEAFVKRVSSHVSQLVSLAKYIVSHGPAMLVLPETIKPQFGFDQALVVLTEKGSVYGLSAMLGGQVSWVYHDLAATDILPDPEVPTQFLAVSNDGVYEISGEGDVIGLRTEEVPVAPADAVEINGNVISSRFGWKLDLPGDVVVGHAAKDPKEASGSVVVPTSKGDVLYKYLQPFQAVYASYGTDSRVLTLTLVDTVTGRILAMHAHAEPVIVNDEWPLAITFGEHWFAYSFLSLDESQTMKLTVVDLFESAELNTRVSASDVNVWSDTTKPAVSMHTWILPSRNQPVYSMAVSVSPFGAAARDLLMGFEHQVVSLPKAMLNTLDPLPDLFIPQGGHLSHVYGIEEATQLVVGRTNSEFTYYLAAIGKNSDLFCSRIAPAGDVDRLSFSFPKVKLLIFVGSVTFAMITLSPLARNKVLKLSWR